MVERERHCGDMRTMTRQFIGRSHRLSGFTLVETLVALAIVAAVAATVAPAAARGIDAARFDAAVREVASGLKSVRQAALAEQREAEFVLNVQTRTYVAAGRERPLSVPPEAVSLVTATSERIDEWSGAIRFFADGSSSGGSVQMSVGRRSATVSVAWLTGRVHVVR